MFLTFLIIKFNSLVPMLLDWELMVCHYSMNVSAELEEVYPCENSLRVSRIIVSILPAWIRFAQCLRRFYDSRQTFPHCVNMGKYLLSIIVTIGM